MVTESAKILQIHDSPLSLKNGVWKITQRLDLWNNLGSRVLDQNLETFRSIAVRTLKEVNPAFELPIEERYAASVHGKVTLYSSAFRESIAEGLAILGSYSGAASHCSLGKAELTVVLAVREILDQADWVVWGSLNNQLPSLAEAAPNEFLESVEKALRLNPCPFDELFRQEGSGFNGRNYMTGLLWALESLAWDEQYLVRVCVILGELASHDPGGQWINRPSNSLSMILLPWLPQTLASVEKRQTAVRTLLNEFPDIAWKLIVQLLPHQHQTSSGTHKPNWRKFIPDSWEKGVTSQEYWQQSIFYADLAVEVAGKEVDKLCTLTGYFDHLPEKAFNKLVSILSTEDITNLPDEEKNTLWNSLTTLTARHRRHSDAKWALPDDFLTRLEQLAEPVAPKDLLVLYQRLFSDRDFDFYEENESWQEQRKKLDKKRESAIRDILLKDGVDGVIRFSESVISSHQVGSSLAAIDDAAIDSRILPEFLTTENHKQKSLAASFVWSKHYIKGWGWCDNLDKSAWKSQQVGQFLAFLPFTKETWVRASTLLGENESVYWLCVNANAYDAGEAIIEGVEKLLEHGRPYAAINCLTVMRHNKQAVDTNVCARALIAALSSSESTEESNQYQMTEIIQAIQKDKSVDPDVLFRVEWAYLPLLDRFSGAEPKFLEHKLANDPDFFCELIRLIYRSKNEKKIITEPTEQEKAVATNAWRLLHNWKIVPGTQRDGMFSVAQFLEWLQRVKEICAESGHLDVALVSIGSVLIHAPADPDGLRLHRVIATALNDREADLMRNGFSTGIYNSRGAHAVDPSGAPEKTLADKYRNQSEEIENAGFHRLAITLREVSEGHERQAQRIINSYGDR